MQSEITAQSKVLPHDVSVSVLKQVFKLHLFFSYALTFGVIQSHSDFYPGQTKLSYISVL